LKLREIEPSERNTRNKCYGTDENGNNVHGNINIEGKLVLVPQDAMEIEIVVEMERQTQINSYRLRRL
jgi:hypothetical protein